MDPSERSDGHLAKRQRTSEAQGNVLALPSTVANERVADEGSILFFVKVKDLHAHTASLAQLELAISPWELGYVRC